MSQRVEERFDNLQAKGMAKISALLDKGFTITDPYFIAETRYSGTPKYLDPKQVDTSKVPDSKVQELAGSLAARLSGYKNKDLAQPWLTGGDLRARNIWWWNKALPPEEYPLKIGQWRTQAKRAAKAVDAARARRPAPPGKKPKGTRAKKGWLFLPDMPDRPELAQTSALVYAVRLGRPTTVRALLDAHVPLLNAQDAWGYTPVCYALHLLAKERDSVVAAAMADMLLERRPLVNLRGGVERPTIMAPVVSALISGDAQRLAYLVTRCVASLNTAYVYLPDVPAYFTGLWERTASQTQSRVPPLHLAVMHRKLDLVKLTCDLGANPNLYGQPLDAEKVRAKRKKEYDAECEVIMAAAQEIAENDGKLRWQSKARLGVMAQLKKLKKAIASIEIPGWSKPHPWVTPLHLAARYGLPDICLLLVQRGALVNGGGAAVYARRTPLQEALYYARQNFRVANLDAARANWSVLKERTSDIPSMSEAAAAREAQQQANKLLSMLDPLNAGLKAIALAAKAVILILLEMRKRPIAHWDPALAGAHVLLLAGRSPVDPAETQTQIVLRDVMDNGTWRWLEAAPEDAVWVKEAVGQVEELKGHEDFGYEPMRTTLSNKDYKKLKREFLGAADTAYYATGAQALHRERRDVCKAAMDAVRKHMKTVYVQETAARTDAAIKDYVAAVEAGAGALGTARAKAYMDAAARLEGGVKLVEAAGAEGAPPALVRTSTTTRTLPPAASNASMRKPPPATAAVPAAPVFVVPAVQAAGAGGPTPAQAETAAGLKARSKQAAEEQAEGMWTGGGARAGDLGDNDTHMFVSPKTDPGATKDAVLGVDEQGLADLLQLDLEEQVDTFMGYLTLAQELAEGLADMLEYVGVSDDVF